MVKVSYIVLIVDNLNTTRKLRTLYHHKVSCFALPITLTMVCCSSDPNPKRKGQLEKDLSFSHLWIQAKISSKDLGKKDSLKLWRHSSVLFYEHLPYLYFSCTSYAFSFFKTNNIVCWSLCFFKHKRLTQ